MKGFAHGPSTLIGRWLARRRARARLTRRLAILYHPRYVAPYLAGTARVARLDLTRGERILGALAEERLVAQRDIRAPSPVSLRALRRVHSEDYLERVGHEAELAHVFGLDPRDLEVDEVLEAQRLAVGGTEEAASWAVAGEGREAFNLGGGFHHAEPEIGMGFCLFNDVAVAVRSLRHRGFDSPIAIVDLDVHQGNGNLVTFAEDPSVLTLSMHGSRWVEVNAKADLEISLPSGTEDRTYLEALEYRLLVPLRQLAPRLVFYVAGNDVLQGDDLGSFALSPEGVFKRDRRVVETVRELGASLVITLAGGYSDQAWMSSHHLLRWMLTDLEDAPSIPEASDLRRDFARIARSLDRQDLQGEHPSEDDPWQLTEADLLGDLVGAPPARRILGFYSVHGIELALERYGLLDGMRARGFDDLDVSVDPSDPARQRITVRGRKEPGPARLLMDLVLSRRKRPTSNGSNGARPLELLSIEWLQLQDPSASFSLRQPPLPRQEHPGLGMVREVMEMLVQSCLRLGLDGIVIHPSAFHVAALAAGHGSFLDPRLQGRFEAARAALSAVELGEASRIVEEGRLRDVDGEVLRWAPDDFVIPVSERLQRWFEHPAYREQVEVSRRVELQSVA